FPSTTLFRSEALALLVRLGGGQYRLEPVLPGRGAGLGPEVEPQRERGRALLPGGEGSQGRTPIRVRGGARAVPRRDEGGHRVFAAGAHGAGAAHHHRGPRRAHRDEREPASVWRRRGARHAGGEILAVPIQLQSRALTRIRAATGIGSVRYALAEHVVINLGQGAIHHVIFSLG